MPSAGPYYVASYTPGQGAVLKRNPNYGGARPHALDEIDYSVGIGAAQIVKELDDGTADFGVVDDLPPGQLASLTGRYGSEQPGRPSRRTAVLRQLIARPREPRPEHEPAVVRKRGSAQSGELCARPPGDRPRLPTPGDADRPVPPAGHPGLPRHPRLPAQRGPREGTTPRPRPPRPRRPLCLRHARLSRGRTPDPERACADRDQRRDQVDVELLHDLQPHRISARAVRHGPRRLVPRLPRPLRHPELPLRRPLDQSRRRTATTPTSTIPSTTASSPPRHSSPARGATPRTGRSKPISCATPHRRHRSSTR